MSDHSDNNNTPPNKRKRMCVYNKLWEKSYDWVTNFNEDIHRALCKPCKASILISYDGLKALKTHMESKKHKDIISAVSSSQKLHAFFTQKDSPQSEKVAIAELAHVYHGIKHHLSYLSQDCAVKVIKCTITDSEIAKQMTGGRTKSMAIANNVLYPFSMELTLSELKNGVPFSLATDASNKGNRKMYPVALQFFSVEEGLSFKILDFYEDPFEDSTSIHKKLSEVLQKKIFLGPVYLLMEPTTRR